MSVPAMTMNLACLSLSSLELRKNFERHPADLRIWCPWAHCPQARCRYRTFATSVKLQVEGISALGLHLVGTNRLTLVYLEYQ